MNAEANQKQVIITELIRTSLVTYGWNTLKHRILGELARGEWWHTWFKTLLYFKYTDEEDISNEITNFIFVKKTGGLSEALILNVADSDTLNSLTVDPKAIRIPKSELSQPNWGLASNIEAWNVEMKQGKLEETINITRLATRPAQWMITLRWESSRAKSRQALILKLTCE